MMSHLLWFADKCSKLAVFTIARTWKMPIDRSNILKLKNKIKLKKLKKEVVVHMNNGILLGHKKELIRVSSNEVDEPRDYYTE